MGADLESDRIGGKSPAEVEIQERAQRHKQALHEARRSLFARKDAYVRVFGRQGEDPKMVLADFEKFCRANRSTFHQDPRMHAVMEGRREVYLRLSHHLSLNYEELWALYNDGRGE